MEHVCSPGTISLRVESFMSLLNAVVGDYVRATPARRLLIVNGHGGNRGILEAAIHELRQRYALAACVVHPCSLSAVRVDSEVPEIHAGLRETSMMLALAPDDVHLDWLPADFTTNGISRNEVQRLVLDRGASWPWSSGDNNIAAYGVTGGDPRAATADVGESIVDSALGAAGDVLRRLTAQRP